MRARERLHGKQLATRPRDAVGDHAADQIARSHARLSRCPIETEVSEWDRGVLRGVPALYPEER